MYFYFFIFNIIISLIFLNLDNKSIINKRYFLNINIMLFTLLYIYTMSTNYIVLLLSLETITTLYYFFFLKTTRETNFSLIKYKNLISYYLWLSFFTLLFFSANLIVLTYSYGTLNFLELRFFNLEHKYYVLLFIAFFWKLGVPLFHFFKLELYRYLDFIGLVLFSIISLSINSFMFLYFLQISNTVFQYNEIIVILCTTFNLILLLQSIEKIYLYYFFAISGINTWSFFLIILTS